MSASRFYGPRNVCSVQMAREEMFGSCLLRAHEGKSSLTWEETLSLIKKHQPCDPCCPRNGTAALHSAVARELSITPEALEFYTAVGSSLYKRWGIVAFFCRNEVGVAIDVILNPRVYVGHACVLVHESDQFTNYIRPAREIAEHLTRGLVRGYKGLLQT